jgi:hypothetical protein
MVDLHRLTQPVTAVISGRVCQFKCESHVKTSNGGSIGYIAEERQKRNKYLRELAQQGTVISGFLMSTWYV